MCRVCNASSFSLSPPSFCSQLTSCRCRLRHVSQSHSNVFRLPVCLGSLLLVKCGIQPGLSAETSPGDMVCVCVLHVCLPGLE